MKKIIYTLLLLLVVCQVADAKKIKNQSRNSGNKSQLAAKEQWPNFIDNFFDWLVSPWRPVWGEFKIDGQNTTAPMALFHSNTFANDIGAIRGYINSSSTNEFKETYKDLYEKIFDNHTPKSLVYTIEEKEQSQLFVVLCAGQKRCRLRINK